MNKKGNVGGVIGAGIGVIVLLIALTIVGSVENGTTWSQTLSGTVGAYLEPLAALGGLVLAGSIGVRAMRR